MTIITAILEVIKALLSYKTTETSNKPILDAIKDKSKLKKASNITEDIIKLADIYQDKFTKRDLNRYKHLKERFFKVN